MRYQYPYLERHLYSPEQNTLHLSLNERIKVGFFNLNHNPTLQDAVKFAFPKCQLVIELIQSKQFNDLCNHYQSKTKRELIKALQCRIVQEKGSFKINFLDTDSNLKIQVSN